MGFILGRSMRFVEYDEPYREIISHYIQYEQFV